MNVSCAYGAYVLRHAEQCIKRANPFEKCQLVSGIFRCLHILGSRPNHCSLGLLEARLRSWAFCDHGD
ncbi:MAG: hypothetical protein ABI454_11365, partial [Sphingomicrobium sp.]